MSEKSDPEIKSDRDIRTNFTKITFWPDFEKFKMTGFDSDILALMRKRALDLAGVTPNKIKVHLDGELLDIKDFQA